MLRDVVGVEVEVLTAIRRRRRGSSRAAAIVGVDIGGSHGAVDAATARETVRPAAAVGSGDVGGSGGIAAGDSADNGMCSRLLLGCGFGRRFFKR